MPWFRVSAPAALGALFFANGFGFATWAARVPAVRDGLGLSDGELGSALFAIGLGALLAFLWAGRGVARLGARTLTLGATAAYCLLLAQPALAANGAVLGFTLLLWGAANGAMDVAMNALAVEVEAQAQRPVMSWLHGLWSAGGLAGATLGAAAAGAGLSAAVHLGAVAAGLALLALAARPHLPPSQPAPAAADEPRLARPERELWGLGAIVFSSFLIEGAMADWSAVLLRDAMDATPAFAALGYSAFALAMMVLRLGGDRLVARWGAVPLLRWANVAAAIALAAALASAHREVTLLAFVLLGLGVATVAPLVFRAAAERSRRGPGQGIAAMATLGYGGFLAGPAVIGWLAELVTLRGALGVMVGLALALAGLAGQLRPR